MADFATALLARLIGNAEVSTAVAAYKTSKAIFWGIVPQDASLAYIRLNTISDPREEHLQGYNSARRTRVQADCFGPTYAAARSLAEKLITATSEPLTSGGVRFGRIKAEGPRDLGEDTASGYIFRASVDLLVEHTMA